jgi:copper resistance protein C
MIPDQCRIITICNKGKMPNIRPRPYPLPSPKASVRIAFAFAVALANSGAALAHAALHRANPEAGSTVSESPHEVTLTFTDSLEAAFSSAEVMNSSGLRVDEGKSQVDGNMIRIGLKTLSPGSYRVHWRAVSVDTHSSEGSFTFNVSGQ